MWEFHLNKLLVRTRRWTSNLKLFVDSCWVQGKIPWRRAWQSTPVFLPRESQGQRSLVGYSLRVAKSWTRLKRLSMHTHTLGSEEASFGLNHSSDITRKAHEVPAPKSIHSSPTQGCGSPRGGRRPIAPTVTINPWFAGKEKQNIRWSKMTCY